MSARVVGVFADRDGPALIVRRSGGQHLHQVGGLALVLGSLVMIFLRPESGPIWAGVGAFLIGIGMGFSNTTFLVSIRTSVDWAKRRIATSASLLHVLSDKCWGLLCVGCGIEH